MFKKYSLWKNILLFFASIHLTIANNNHRANLAQRHPCYSINKRLEPYIKWTERLVSTQYRAQKDVCGQIPSNGPACCTNEIFNSYAISLGTDLKTLFDTELSQLKNLLSTSNKQIDFWTKEYFSESRQTIISSLGTLFGTKEYHSNIHHSIITLFNILGNHQSTDEDVSKSAVNLFNQIILASYRRFMTNKSDIILDDQLQKCLVTKALDIEALPTQREVLYTLSSAASLIRLLRTLFIYIDADIQRLKTTVTLNSQQCLQRYVRETLCPICVSIPSPPSSNNYDNNTNEPLCENDCQFVMKNCLNDTNNPYVAFTVTAQGYSDVIKQIQESVVELKLVERLSKLHIYLYDMVVNATNTQKTYMKLQTACPNEHEKPFSPIISLSPIPNERPELVNERNESLHFMLNQLQSSIDNLNTSLTQQIITDICSNSNYAVKSNRCTQIDQHTPVDLSQWPLPSMESSSQIVLDSYTEPTENQLTELKKKLEPIQQMIVSLRPKNKLSLKDYFKFPEFEYNDDNDDHSNNNDNEVVPSIGDTYEIDNQESLSEKLYREFDRNTTGRPTITTDDSEEKNANHSQLMTYTITSYLFLFVILLIHRISFTN